MAYKQETDTDKGDRGRRSHAFKRALLNVARQCLEAGLLDEIIVHVAPVLVGDGVRLFERAGGAPVNLTPISSANEGGMTVLRYALRQVSPER